MKKKKENKKEKVKRPGYIGTLQGWLVCGRRQWQQEHQYKNEFLFLPLHVIISANIKYLIHVTREFYFAKVICRNLYALFSNVRRAYTVNKNGVQLFITGGRITNQRKRKCL